MIQIFLVAQFFLVGALLLGIITMIFVFHWRKNDISVEYINIIIKFVSAYITSVVVELIAMLKYVVKNVFDTSITGLVQLYRDANIKDEEKQNSDS